MTVSEQGVLSAFGEWLRRLREQRGWTQTEAAAACGVSVQYWNDVERARRKPGAKILNGIAGAWGLPAVVVYLRARVFPDCPELSGVTDGALMAAWGAFVGVLLNWETGAAK